MPKSTGKKGGRKVGRGKASPSHQRYNAEDRCAKNKKRKDKRVAKAIEHGAERKARKTIERNRIRALTSLSV